jgi:CheY-like chemotaxis protein
MTSQLKALVVDDAELSRIMLANSLNGVFSYEEAENGLLAVQKYQDAVKNGVPYDIVFMDIIMPEMDGKAALQKIREYEELNGLPRTPIYMVSASEMLDGVEGLPEGLLRKPASRQLLNEICMKHFPGKVSSI